MTLKKYPHAPRVVGSQNRQPTFICVPGASHHYLARIATFLRSYSHFTSSDADPPAGTPLRGGKIDGNLRASSSSRNTVFAFGRKASPNSVRRTLRPRRRKSGAPTSASSF